MAALRWRPWWRQSYQRIGGRQQYRAGDPVYTDVIYWLVRHYFPGQYLLFVAVMGAVGFVFREVLWEIVGHAWLFLRRLLKLARDETAHAVDTEAPAPARNSVAGGLRAIRDHDPGFDAGAFLQEVQQVCAAVGKGWAEKNLELCRAVMTDVCWRNQRALLDRGFVDGWRGSAGMITFADGQIQLAATQPGADRVVVRVRITCRPGTGKLIRGRRIAEWVEDWTFVRPITLGLPPGAKAPVSIQRGYWRLDQMDHFAVHMDRAEHAA